jgi:hypothetical protein
VKTLRSIFTVTGNSHRRNTIIDMIVQIADQQHKHLAPLTDDLRLLESGLDSICIAILVLRLEPCYLRL